MDAVKLYQLQHERHDMNLEKLRPRIKQALNGNTLNINERVILSTLLYNNIYETAFKLRLSIATIEQTARDFFIKSKGV